MIRLIKHLHLGIEVFSVIYQSNLGPLFELKTNMFMSEEQARAFIRKKLRFLLEVTLEETPDVREKP